MTKFVYDFAEGDKDKKDMLGGKGANLAEMTNLGLPVPPGPCITIAPVESRTVTVTRDPSSRNDCPSSLT